MCRSPGAEMHFALTLRVEVYTKRTHCFTVSTTIPSTKKSMQKIGRLSAKKGQLGIGFTTLSLDVLEETSLPMNLLIWKVYRYPPFQKIFMKIVYPVTHNDAGVWH